MRETFCRVSEHPLNVRLRHCRLPCGSDSLLQRWVFLRVCLDGCLPLAVRYMARLQHSIQPLRANLRPRDHGGHFLLFDHLPINEFLHVGMVEIEAHHFRGATRGSS